MIWLRAAILDWAIIAIAMSVSVWSSWLIPIAILAIGNRQHALAILGHDGAHRLICNNKWLNDLMTDVLVFYPLGLSLKQYRKFHWEHHRNTNTDNDPERPLKSIWPAMQMPFSQRKVIWQLLGDLVGLGIPQLIAFLVHVRPRAIAECGALAFVLVAMCCFVYFDLAFVPLIWFGSLYTTFWMFFRYRIWAEHVGGGPGETLVFDVNWLQRIVFFPHNCHLHHEHHEKPGVPFHKLKRSIVGLTLCEARKLDNFRSAG